MGTRIGKMDQKKINPPKGAIGGIQKISTATFSFCQIILNTEVKFKIKFKTAIGFRKFGKKNKK